MTLLSTPLLETFVGADAAPLALLVRGAATVERSQYLCRADSQFQLSLLLQPAGTAAGGTAENGALRTVSGNSMILLLRRGLCRLELWDSAGQSVGACLLHAGDLLLLHSGRYRLHAESAAELLELRQGPALLTLRQEAVAS